MEIKQKIIKSILTFSVPLIVSTPLVSCGWSINLQDDKNNLFKQEFKNQKFNFTVMPEWTDLNIVGSNEKEWKQLLQIYGPEIKNGEDQIKEINQEVNKDKDLIEFQKTVGWLINVMVLWYKQIKVEIDYNLWLISQNLTFDKILIKNNKTLLNQAKKQLNIISETDKGLFFKWLDSFRQWKKWMNEKSPNKLTPNDKDNWIKVENHLSSKNQTFRGMIEKIEIKLKTSQNN